MLTRKQSFTRENNSLLLRGQAILGKSLPRQMIFGLLSAVILINWCGSTLSLTTPQNGGGNFIVGITFGKLERLSWVLENKAYLNRNGIETIIVTGMKLRVNEVVNLDCPEFDSIVHSSISSTTCLVFELIKMASIRGKSLFRIGDDSFLNITNFLEHGYENSYVGSLLTLETDKKHPGYDRWLKIMGMHCFPTYAAGAGYYLGPLAVRKLSRMDPLLIMNEDVVVGLWVHIHNITKINEVRIKAYHPHGEDNIVSHYIQTDYSYQKILNYIKQS